MNLPFATLTTWKGIGSPPPYTRGLAAKTMILPPWQSLVFHLNLQLSLRFQDRRPNLGSTAVLLTTEQASHQLILQHAQASCLHPADQNIAPRIDEE